MNALATWYLGNSALGHMRYTWFSRQYIERDSKLEAIRGGADYLVIEYNKGREVVRYERHGSRWYKEVF